MAVHRGLTAEQRREQRREQLVEAALDTIAESGVNGLRVRAVSERARLNDRYFYENFRDCQELLLATFDAQSVRGLAGIMTTVAYSPPDIVARTRAVVEFIFGFIDADPRRRRLLRELQTAEALAGRRQELINTLTQTMVGQVRTLLGDAAGSEDHIALASLTTVGGLMELVTQWYGGEITSSREELVDFVTALVVTTSDLTGALERRLTEVRPASSRSEGRPDSRDRRAGR